MVLCGNIAFAPISRQLQLFQIVEGRMMRRSWATLWLQCGWSYRKQDVKIMFWRPKGQLGYDGERRRNRGWQANFPLSAASSSKKSYLENCCQLDFKIWLFHYWMNWIGFLPYNHALGYTVLCKVQEDRVQSKELRIWNLAQKKGNKTFNDMWQWLRKQEEEPQIREPAYKRCHRKREGMEIISEETNPFSRE